MITIEFIDIDSVYFCFNFISLHLFVVRRFSSCVCIMCFWFVFIALSIHLLYRDGISFQRSLFFPSLNRVFPNPNLIRPWKTFNWTVSSFFVNFFFLSLSLCLSRRLYHMNVIAAPFLQLKCDAINFVRLVSFYLWSLYPAKCSNCKSKNRRPINIMSGDSVHQIPLTGKTMIKISHPKLRIITYHYLLSIHEIKFVWPTFMDPKIYIPDKCNCFSANMPVCSGLDLKLNEANDILENKVLTQEYLYRITILSVQNEFFLFLCIYIYYMSTK